MKVRHPNLNEPNVLDVDESAVEEYLAAGWKPVDEKPAAEEPTETPADEEKPARAPRKPTSKPDAGDKE